ncbi:MAG TPA: glycoside hydrolase domain-containing protein [Acidimicrobiales bacterium]|nr:glycoside hydrolase domain-containing protein [Acidimicrobiales bacterium]
MTSGSRLQVVTVAAILPATDNSVKVAEPATKTVTFGGYAVSVPAGWPVYDLAKDLRRCVRYDIHAVYLGAPGPDQDCSPGLVGRVETVSIGSAAQTPAMAGLRTLAPGTIVQDPDLHELALAMPDAAPPVEATYATDPGPAEQILATVRPDGTQPPARHPVLVEDSIPTPATSTTSATPDAPTSGPSLRPDAPARAGSPAPAPLAGFDTCAAPSLATMKVWRAKYAATVVYIGGPMMACDQSNLSAGWVQRAEAMGWALMPMYVGLQPPCDSYSGRINPKQAASQGTAAANHAIAAASSYSLGPGSPIYYDMEAYDRTKPGCHTAVLTFLDAWTRQLRSVGYVPGVYSSADAAIEDLQTTTTIAGHPLAEPKAVWIALWDNAANVSGAPYVTSAVWPAASRSKQYAGNKMVRVGGISLDIDADLAGIVAARVTRRTDNRTG